MKKSRTAETAEYRLFVAPVYNERNQKFMTRVVLETTRIFASFRYDLTVDEERAGRALTYTVKGISAPKLDLPSAGPARFVRTYDDLSGSWTLTVNGLDGSKCTCTLRIGSDRVKVVTQGPERSIEIVTDPRLMPAE